MLRAVLAAFCCLSISAHAAEPARFLFKLLRPSGETVVVAEGDFELHSAGSYSVRYYSPSSSPDGAPVFASGLILPRTGSIEKVILGDVNADAMDEVIVVFRPAGGGDGFAAQVFEMVDEQIAPLFSLSDLVSDADLMETLRERGARHAALTRRQAQRVKK